MQGANGSSEAEINTGSGTRAPRICADSGMQASLGTSSKKAKSPAPSFNFGIGPESSLTLGGLPKGGQYLLVLEFRQGESAGTYRSLTRKQLLDEARNASLPLRLRDDVHADDSDEHSPVASRRRQSNNYGDNRSHNYGDHMSNNFGDHRSNNYGDHRSNNYGDNRSNNYGDNRSNNYDDSMHHGKHNDSSCAASGGGGGGFVGHEDGASAAGNCHHCCHCRRCCSIGGGDWDEDAAGADVPLMARDVRKVDPMFAGRLEPVILVRCGSITVSLGRTELRAIILHDRLYLIVPDGADSILQLVQKNLAIITSGNGSLHEGSFTRTSFRERDEAHVSITIDSSSKRRQRGSKRRDRDNAGMRAPHTDDYGRPVPFEFAALEAVLLSACSELHKQQELATAKVREALLSLRRSVRTRVVAGARQLENVRELKQQVRELIVQATALQRSLEAVLEEDEDMERMYLTMLHTLPSTRRSKSKHTEHEEAEMLLECYLQAPRCSRDRLQIACSSRVYEKNDPCILGRGGRMYAYKVEAIAAVQCGHIWPIQQNFCGRHLKLSCKPSCVSNEGNI